jgi:peptidoglycan hydrolase-like protein with peptidoglycan-binding domain
MILISIGCATARQSSRETESQQLKARIDELEKELAWKEQENLQLQQTLADIDKDKQQYATAKMKSGNLTPKQIQKALKQAGFYSGAVDGKIGKNTKKAILDFQSANGLKADGIVGKKTAEKLQTYLQQ